jgi:two-component system, chemotaxis family, sensor kinase Cph1
MKTPAVDLTNCDREPIHTPGAIQPHGILLVLAEPGFTIIQASANAHETLAIEASAVLGASLADVLQENAVATIRRLCASPTITDQPHYISQCRLKNRGGFWSAAIHRRNLSLLLELQPLAIEDKVSYQTQDLVRQAIAELDTCDSLLSFCQAATEHFRSLTRFDRVMVYRFLEDGSGMVLAESRAPGLDAYLGLRYPASDIPAQARELYRLYPFRLTADVQTPVVPITPVLNPFTQAPLDLSFCALRATSPIHLEYLRNMGVRASLSFSILHQDTLWGLVACHHRSPRVISQETRLGGEILSRFLGLQVEIKEEMEGKWYAAQLQTVRSQLHAQLSASGDYVTALTGEEPNLLSGLKASGVALCTGKQTVLLGQTPSLEQVNSFSQWIEQQPWQPVWCTHHLASHYPQGHSFSAVASGVLVLRIAESSPETVIWFRPELLETVNWAGNPTKAVEPSAETGEVQLHPRRSFALWQEQVRGRSAPWQPIEQEHALALHKDLSQALLKHRAREVSRLNAELTRTNQELEQFSAMASHDLQEPLRTITAYTDLVFRRKKSEFDPDTAEMIGFVLSATKRMSMLIQSLLEYARVGLRHSAMERVAVGDALEVALRNLSVFVEERNAQIRVSELPTVHTHRDQLARVFQNLIANAIKYCPTDRTPILTVTAERRGTEWCISLQDNGIGFDPAQKEAIFQSFYRLHREGVSGTGLGLAICRKIMQSLGGRIWAETMPGEGSIFRLTLPAL